MRRRSNYGWFELIIGILLVILGVFTFVRPGTTLRWLVMIYGGIAVATGISDILFYVRTERYTGFGPTVSLITGIFGIMAGVMLLTYPNAGKWIMVLLVPIWFIAHCISKLSHLPEIRMGAGDFYYYFTMVVNIIGIVLGCLMIVRPILSLFTSQFIIGIYLVLIGVDTIVMAAGKMGSR